MTEIKHFSRRARLLVILLLLAPAASLAGPDDRAKPAETGKTSEAEKKPLSVNQPAKQKPDTSTFTPSEKIRADEAVSFPVDI